MQGEERALDWARLKKDPQGNAQNQLLLMHKALRRAGTRQARQATPDWQSLRKPNLYNCKTDEALRLDWAGLDSRRGHAAYDAG